MYRNSNAIPLQRCRDVVLLLPICQEKATADYSRRSQKDPLGEFGTLRNLSYFTQTLIFTVDFARASTPGKNWQSSCKANRSR